MVPKDLLTLFLIAMLLTKDNKRAYLNIAFSYTGLLHSVQITSSERIEDENLNLYH